MKTHTVLGRDAIRHAEEQLGTSVGFLRLAKEIAYSHHEKWGGTGYPDGLSADDNPISAKLIALADAYDALISRRVYKKGMSHDQALEIIRQGCATHFDPDICEVFLANHGQFQAIAVRFDDRGQDG